MLDIYDSLDPMKKMNEAMQRAIDPMYDINKSLNFATSVSDRATESLRAIQPLEEFNKMMESITNPFSAYEKMMADLNPMKKLNKQMESILDPFKKIQEQMDSLYSIPDFSFENSAMKEVERFQASLDTALGTTSLQKYNDLFFNQMESYKKMEEALTSITSSIGSNSYASVNSVIEKILEQESRIETAILSEKSNDVLAEFTLLKEEILESLDSHHLKVEQQLEKIYTVLVSLKNPLLLALFVSFIFPIIINNISNVIYDNAVKPTISAYTNAKAQQTKFKKEVINGAQSVLNMTGIVANYRIVTVDVLNVRESNSVKSKVIAYAFFGEIVEIVNKKKNWCLIKRYDSENETYIQGLVFTRYLGRIR